jgi:hypothetical protein
MSSSRLLSATVFAAGLAAAAGTAASLSAQDKDTMWTKVAAEGSVITLSWDKNHPWNAELAAGGVALMARYRAGGRPVDVADVVAKGTVQGKNARFATFTLPEDVRAIPQSSVCLYFQMPNRRVIPIRRSTKLDGDTAGFTYDIWERRIRARATVREGQTRVAAAQRALAEAESHVTSQQTVLTTRGWTSQAACDGLAVPQTAVEAKPYGVVPPEQQDEIARRVCVFRVWRSQQYAEAIVERLLKPSLKSGRDLQEVREMLDAMYSAAFMLPDVAGPLLKQLNDAGGTSVPGFAARETQAAAFLADWARYGGSSANYQPHLGRDRDRLGWVGSAASVAIRVHARRILRELNAEWALEGEPPATADEARSLIGIALDAYGGCVDDAKVQLRLQYDQWQSLQSSAPQRAASAAAFFAKECRQGISLLDKLKAEVEAMRAQATREQAAFQAAQAASVTLPTKTLQLNAATCGEP